ncbi:MAG: uracil-DNA glycosylase [Chloroflexi bacterium]|nr:uracil-DNA glycosylase [Chloroflexota bacterium]
MSFDQLRAQIIACRRCLRLVEWREQVAREKRKAYRDQEYWGKPVPGFGDPHARVFVVGLAPGAHGSNRTGRMFTGDASGDFLYPALFRAGFASQPHSLSRNDGMILRDMYITASGRCAPPDNKPSREELDNCQSFLEREIELIQPNVIVVLGRIAFERILRVYSARIGQGTDDRRRSDSASRLPSSVQFAHGAVFTLPASSFTIHPSSLLCSYHPSQQNTSTGKLTAGMFGAIWRKAKKLSGK